MPDRDPLIRSVDGDELEAFVTYLEDLTKDNGVAGGPYFQPMSRSFSWTSADVEARFRSGLAAPMGGQRWRRLWCAYDSAGTILGHVDLRAHDEPSTEHRALLGTGVHRTQRRRGLGRILVEWVVAWARRETTLAWIDLHFLHGNVPASRLYERLGFSAIATVPDMFRVDGQSLDDVIMTKRIRA